MAVIGYQDLFKMPPGTAVLLQVRTVQYCISYHKNEMSEISLFFTNFHTLFHELFSENHWIFGWCGGRHSTRILELN